MNRSYVFRYLLPGVVLIGFAFFMGSQYNFIFGLIGFLSFITIGVTLIVEGWRKKR